MSESTSFFSTCPRCKNPRLQTAYEPIELLESLNGDQVIDAYCLTCDVVWPISARDRSLVATLVAVKQEGRLVRT